MLIIGERKMITKKIASGIYSKLLTQKVVSTLIIGFLTMSSCSQRTNGYRFISSSQSDSQTQREVSKIVGPEVPIMDGKSFQAGNPVGNGPMTYEIISGPGSIDPKTGIYKAVCQPINNSSSVLPSDVICEDAAVRATDPVTGNTYDTPFKIYRPLDLPKLPIGIVPGDPLTAGPTVGGKGPITYSISPVCKIDSKSGVISECPVVNAPVEVTVKACDSLGNCDEEKFTLYPPLKVEPAIKYLGIGQKFIPTISGGVGNKSCSITMTPGSATGSFNASTCEFTASTVGDISINVVDQGNPLHRASSLIHVVSGIQLNVNRPVITLSNTAIATASGGSPAYIYSSDVTAINASTGVYTPSKVGPVNLSVVDSLGQRASVKIDVVPTYSISISPSRIAVGNSAAILHNGGVGPYTCSVTGPGSVSGSNVIGSGSGTVNVSCKDSLENTATGKVDVASGFSASANPPIIMVGNNSNVVASGGVGPYSYTQTSGSGSTSPSGVYTSVAPGNAVVKACDSLNNCVSVTIQVNAALTFEPASVNLTVNSKYNKPAQGGVGTITYTATCGSVNSSTSEFTAPSTPSSCVETATDSVGNKASRTYSIKEGLSAVANPTQIPVGATSQITPTGGVGPYQYSLISGSGSVSVMGVYSGTAVGDAVVKVSDSLDNSVNVSIKVIQGLSVNPVSKTLPVSSSFTPTFSGVNGTLVCKMLSGGGTVEGSTGKYTAPSVVGTSQVECSDSIGQKVTITYTIVKALALNPPTASLSANKTLQYIATDGSPEYKFSIQSGIVPTFGSIDSKSGLFSSLKLWTGDSGTTTVKVEDTAGAVANAKMQLLPSIVQYGASAGNGNNSQETTGGASVFDSQDNYYLVGSTTSPSFGEQIGTHGDIDCAIQKMDKNGSLIWSKQIGAGSGKKITCASAGAVVDKDDNLYFVGDSTSESFGPLVGDTKYFSGNGLGFIGKVDKNGSLVWVKQLGDKDEVRGTGHGLSIREIAISPKADEIFVSGSTGNSTVFKEIGTAGTGGTPYDSITPFVAKFKTDGTFIAGANVSIGSNGSSEVTSQLAVDSAGDVVVMVYTTGSSKDSITGVPCEYQWQQNVSKVSGDLSKRYWVKLVGGMDGGARGLAFDASNNLIMTGVTKSTNSLITNKVIGTRGASDLMIVKADTNGKYIDHKIIGMGANSNANAEVQWSYRAKVLSSGEILLSGNVRSGNAGTQYGTAGESDVFLMKLNASDLNPLFTSQLGFQTNLGSSGLIVSSKGEIFITGQSALSTPNVQLGSHLKSDFFTVKFSAAGVAQQ